MIFYDLFARLAALPDPDEEEIPAELGTDFSGIELGDLKKIALGQVSDDCSGEDTSNAAVQAYRVIAIRGGAEDLPFFMEVMSVWDGFFVEDVLSGEFPWVMEQLGDGVVPIALELMKDRKLPEMHRAWVLEGLEAMAEKEEGEEVIFPKLGEQLRELRPERMLNAFLISAMIEQCPEKYHDEIQAAFRANVVDVSVTGDLEDVEIGLGIREERETEERSPHELEEELALQYRRDELGEFPEKGDTFEKADYVLWLYKREGSVSGAAMLDGVYAAVICSPMMVRPAALFSLPWDLDEASPDKAPNFENDGEAKRVSSVLMDFYNEINSGIEAVEYVPSIQFFENEEDEKLSQARPESWLLGLVMGARYLEENLGKNDYTQKISEMAMERMMRIDGGETFDIDSVVELVSPLIETLLLARHQEKERLAGKLEQGGGFLSGVTEQVVRSEAKVGRNDPCPCGSGKKFKKCCAN